MTDTHNPLGTINHDYPPFLGNPQIEKILRDFAVYSKLEKFYLAGGFIVDRLFYPDRPSNDIDLTVYGCEDIESVLQNLSQAGEVSEIEEFSRNLVSKGKYVAFAPHDQKGDQKYDVVFLPVILFGGLVSPECPLIEYPSGVLIEQGPNLQAHRDKTIEFTRPIAQENKQVLLTRFIHSACKYNFPLTHPTNQRSLSLLRTSFEQRDPQEMVQAELDLRDDELIAKIKTAANRPNDRWLEMKENLVAWQFDKVLSDRVWQIVLSVPS